MVSSLSNISGYLSVRVSKVDACSLGRLVLSSHFSSVRGEMCKKFAKSARLMLYFSLIERITNHQTPLFEEIEEDL